MHAQAGFEAWFKSHTKGRPTSYKDAPSAERQKELMKVKDVAIDPFPSYSMRCSDMLPAGPPLQRAEVVAENPASWHC